MIITVYSSYIIKCGYVPLFILGRGHVICFPVCSKCYLTNTSLVFTLIPVIIINIILVLIDYHSVHCVSVGTKGTM